MGLVETWGQGIDKICNGLKEAKQKPPIIIPSKTNFVIEFKAKMNNDIIKKNINDTVKSRNDTVNLGNDTVNLGNDTVNLENDTVNLKNDTVKLENDTVKSGNDTVNLKNDTVKSGNDTVKSGNDTVNLKNDTVNLENDTVIISEDTLLGIIKNNNTVTIIDLIKIFKKSRPTIVRYLKRLKEKDKIERVGSDKSGQWKIK